MFRFRKSVPSSTLKMQKPRPVNYNYRKLKAGINVFFRGIKQSRLYELPNKEPYKHN